MRKITPLVVLFLALTPWATHGPGMNLHPGYNLYTMHPASFNPQVCGMEFLPDGRLVVVTWKGASTLSWSSNGGRWGEAFVLTGMDGTSGAAVTATKIATGFKDAMGVTVVGGEIYVGDADRIVHLTTPINAGIYTQQLVGSYPSSPNGWFEYSFGPVFSNNNFYMSLAVHVKSSGDTITQLSADRGTVISVPMSGGAYSVVASGFRAPDGIALGPLGEIFVTDNQGGWTPTSKLEQVVQGRFYGYNTLPPGRFQTQPMTQPSLWLPYSTSGVNDSPTEPFVMPTGIFAGQMFYGDVGRGGLYRAFLEKVRDPVSGLDEYQGSAHYFTGGLECGMHRIKIRPNGDIFVGGLGNGGHSNQGWNGTTFGLQKIVVKNQAPVFEMLAVRSRLNGMEIEFTQPVGAAANTISNYAVSTWNYIPVVTYGGGMQPIVNLTVNSVQVSTDRLRVFLGITGLRTGGFVVKITPSRNILSQATSDTLLYKDTWYTLRAMSQTAFNPTRLVESGSRDLSPRGIQISRSVLGELKIMVPTEENYRAQVSDFQGRVLAERVITSGSANFGRGTFRPGVYLVQVSKGTKRLVRKIAI